MEKHLRADHRVINKLCTTNGKSNVSTETLSKISDVFVKAGGSWEKIFKGSPGDHTLLIDSLKWVFKHAQEK